MILAIIQLFAALFGQTASPRPRRPGMPDRYTGRVWVPPTRKRRGYWRRM